MISQRVLGFVYAIFLPISMSWAQNVVAFDDHLGSIIYDSRSVSVLSNDIYPVGAVLSIVSYTNATRMSNPPRIKNGTEIEIYPPQALGQDQIKYSLCAGSVCDTSILYTYIYTGFFTHAITDIYVIRTLDTKNLDVLKNDVEANASALTIKSPPSHGTAIVQGSKINYTPNNLSFVVDSLDYQICIVNSSICYTARVYINCYNPKPPVIKDIFVEMDEDKDYNFMVNIFLDVYIDPQDDKMSGIKIVKLPDHGTLEYKQNILPINTFVETKEITELEYKPRSNYNGIDLIKWQALSSTGVSNTASINIKVNEDFVKLTFYEGFSPNGDSRNDKWIIEGIDDYPNSQVRIFNRFGIVIFHTSNYDNKSRVWKGETNINHLNQEHLAPDDVYYYLVELKNGQKLKGSIVLKR